MESSRSRPAALGDLQCVLDHCLTALSTDEELRVSGINSLPSIGPESRSGVALLACARAQGLVSAATVSFPGGRGLSHPGRISPAGSLGAAAPGQQLGG